MLREFTVDIVVIYAIIVYIPPAADTEAACDVMYFATSRLQTLYSKLYNCHFNYVTHQFANCITTENRTLDILFASGNNANISSVLPPLRRSDHNLVLLAPTYWFAVLRQFVTKKTIRRWSQDVEDAIQICFETTGWEGLCEAAGEDIINMTDCIMDCINFCTPQEGQFFS